MSNLLDLLNEYADKKGVTHLGELLKRNGCEYCYSQFLESGDRIKNYEAITSTTHIKNICNLLKANLEDFPF